jgi:hypothetical protein
MADPIVTNTPYELLVRWDEQGALKGAHFQRRQRVSLDGAVIADRLLDPAPITAQDLPGHAVLGEVLADVLAALSRVQARVDELEAAAAGEGI